MDLRLDITLRLIYSSRLKRASANVCTCTVDGGGQVTVFGENSEKKSMRVADIGGELHVLRYAAGRPS